jgi:superfamily II DNA or RNA helicase
MIEFRDYQEQIIDRGLHTLQSHGFLYLSMEVRTGKTLTALGICDRMPDVQQGSVPYQKEGDQQHH